MKEYKSTAQCGFTLLELIVVIVIFSSLVAVLLSRVPLFQELAEKTAMEQMVGTIRSALHLRVANYVAKGRIDEIPKLAQDNPMDWLAEKPKNYMGEYYDPQPGEISAGNWYFDRKSRDLVYLVERGDHFVVPGKSGQKAVRFGISFLYDSQQPKRDGAGQELEGAVFDAREPYSWKAS